MKESGFVLLGRRGETNRSVLAIARGKIIPDVLKKGHKEIQVEQLQGKKKNESIDA